MRINREAKPLVMSGIDDGSEMTVRYNNYGDPFREGVKIELKGEFMKYSISATLDVHDVEILRDKLTEFLNQGPE